MSTPIDSATPPGTLSKQSGVSQQWQIPLLLGALVLFIVSLLELRVSPPPPSFEAQFEQLQGLMKGKLFNLVVQDAAELLGNEDLSPAESARLYQITAEATYRAEASLRVHNQENARGIIRSLACAEANGLTLTGADWQRSGAAWEWLTKPERALDDYTRALQAGLENALEIERRVIELRGALGRLPVEEHHRLLDEYLARAAEDPAALVWAVREKVDLLGEEGKFDQAWELLASAQPRLEGMRESRQLEYLSAHLLYRSGRPDDAERTLRSLRAKLRLRDETYARATWLLGLLHLQDDRPHDALTFFQDVIDSYVEGPYLAASLLGAAQAQVTLLENERAAELCRRLVGLLPFDFESRIINAELVRTSLTVLSETLHNQGRYPDALIMIELANRAMQDAEPRIRALYLDRLAEAHVTLAEYYKKQTQRASRDELASGPEPDGSEESDMEPTADDLMRTHYAAAAETYLRLSPLLSHDEKRATMALWNAADYFDRAGETRRTIDVLEEFVRTRTSSSQMPLALLRLGQSYQALQQYDQAIKAYRDNTQQYPHTPAAVGSVMPLAQCYLEMGEEHYEQAEEVLQSLLNQSGEKEALITPSAREYRQALFLLSDIYVRLDEYENAITVLEECIARYPDDPDAGQAKFLLANSYRLSSQALKRNGGTSETAAFRQQTLSEVRRRLRRARDLFAEISDPEETRDEHGATGISPEYLRLSLFYQADCLFDLGLYEQALSLYEQAGWKYHDNPDVLCAYVQIINCYLRMGRRDEAMTALKRANQLVGRIPEERFARSAGARSRQQWEDFLQRVEDSTLFR